MTSASTTDQPVWAPAGHPVRNFVTTCVALALIAALLGGAGVTRLRVRVEGTGQGEGNMLTKRFTETFLVHNDAPLAIRVVGLRAEHVELDSFRAVTIDGGNHAVIPIRGRALCAPVPYDGPDAGTVDAQPSLRLRVRTPVGITHTLGSDLSTIASSLCNTPSLPN